MNLIIFCSPIFTVYTNFNGSTLFLRSRGCRKFASFDNFTALGLFHYRIRQAANVHGVLGVSVDKNVVQ